MTKKKIVSLILQFGLLHKVLKNFFGKFRPAKLELTALSIKDVRLAAYV